VTKHREANLEKIQAYDKARANAPHRVQARKEYVTTENGKQARQKANANYRKKYPMKYAAHVITRNHIRDGKLVPWKICSACGSTEKIEGHHDDYTKPLDVRWLCESCHKDWHRHNKPIYE
jgi:transposase-like protein